MHLIKKNIEIRSINETPLSFKKVENYESMSKKWKYKEFSEIEVPINFGSNLIKEIFMGVMKKRSA